MYMKRLLVTSDCLSSSGTTTKQFKPNWKYNENYLKLGFMVKPGTDSTANPIPQCVICQETFSNQSMKPSLLKCQQQTKHPESVNKPIEYFQRKVNVFNKEHQCMTSFVNASY